MMWSGNWRDDVWGRLQGAWDLIIVGGGIIGAGILREATRAGLRALLVEADDFASGTSSRSSKLVHGGFRYLKNAQVKLTLESVRERERLLREGRGLIVPLGFLMPSFETDHLPAWVLGAGLVVYDLLALKWGHRFYDAYDIRELCPQLNEENLRGGYRFFDAQTDDSRLVLRLIQEAVREGGTALNYARAEHLLCSRDGQVRGVFLCDMADDPCLQRDRTCEVQAAVVINATGAWADDLRTQAGGKPRIRKLRGSHLVFPRSKLPLTRAISIWHPSDGRPVYAFGWEGVTIVGTTDVDHKADLETDISISQAEGDYLLAAVNLTFPCLNLTFNDVQSTYSGVRGVVNTGKADPSKESREHILWIEHGLLTVAGGKLTTFRLMAHQALSAISKRLPGKPKFHTRQRVLDAVPAEAFTDNRLDRASRLRLLGRYGADAPELVAKAGAGELQPIGDSPTVWAELRWAAHAEGVVHLDDLLLRRTHLGLILPAGGLTWLERIRTIVQPELGWEDDRWTEEVGNYLNLWKRCYSLVD